MSKTIAVSTELFNQLTAERMWIVQALKTLLLVSEGNSPAEQKARIHATAVLAAIQCDAEPLNLGDL